MFCTGPTGVSVRRGGRGIEMFCTGPTRVSVRRGGWEGNRNVLHWTHRGFS